MQYRFRLFIAASLFQASSLCSQTFYSDSSQTGIPFGELDKEHGMDAVAADVDMDGDPDLIIAHEYGVNALLLNDGKGGFSHAAGRFSNVKNDSEEIGVADFDRDGDPDIVFVAEDNKTHELYTNDGNGFFTEIKGMLPQSICNSVAVADINRDGAPDLVLGNAGQDIILINSGEGALGKGRYFANETAARFPADNSVTQDVKVADLDRDGDMDLVFGNEDKNAVYINDGAGKFTDESEARLDITANTETRKVTIGDADADGDPDIYFSNVRFGGNTAKDPQDRLMINDGDGYFSDETETRIPAEDLSTMDAVFVDADLDGDPDLIRINGFNQISQGLLNDGRGYFSLATERFFPASIKGHNLGIEVADFNGDGLKDFFICRIGQHSGLFFRNPVAVNTEEREAADFSLSRVYPNPAPDHTLVEISLEHEGRVELHLYNSLGERILHIVADGAKGLNTIPISRGNLPPGVYRCLVSCRGRVLSEKLAYP